jgi:AcrR family transcriptional regulator
MPRENHRARLLQGAMRCLREKGYAHTTARDIAAVSNSNLGSIGYHFGSKEALLNEAIREGFAEWTAQLGNIAFAEAGATPLERGRASWWR